MVITPAWLDPNQGRVLKPPADLLAYGRKRDANALILCAGALQFATARRYQPEADGRTWCNIAASDLCQILNAPLPHMLDEDGDGPEPPHEMRANMMADALEGGRYPGWYKVVDVQSAANRAQCGLPTVVVWKNPKPSRPGHIMVCVPVIGKLGLFVSGAGARCGHQMTLAESFGKAAADVRCFGHD